MRPFENLTGDPNEDDYCRGISRVLAAQLRQVRGLNASDSEAGAHKVLEGTVRHQHGRLVVEAHLRSAGDDAVEWTQNYESESNDILKLQVALVRDAVRALNIRLSLVERLRLRRAPTRSVEAFRLYLQALSFLEEPKIPSLKKAESRLRDAIDLDDGFALAHAGLSQALWDIYVKSDTGDLKLLDEAEKEARRADELEAGFPEAQIALAKIYRGNQQHARAIALLREMARQYPTLDETHRQLAITYRQDGQYCEARTSAGKAIALNGSLWLSWNELGTVSYTMGDYEQAREAYAKAAEVAPPGIFSPLMNLLAIQLAMGDFEGAISSSASLPRTISDSYLASNIGTAYFFTDQFGEAAHYFKLAISLTESHYLRATYKRNLGDLLTRQDLQDAARESYSEALDLLNRAPDRHAYRDEALLQRAVLLAKVKDCYTAISMSSEIRSNLPDSVGKFSALAIIYSLCDKPDAALEAFESAIREGAWGAVMGLWDEFEPLAEDPRFKKLVSAKPRVTVCPD